MRQIAKGLVCAGLVAGLAVWGVGVAGAAEGDDLAAPESFEDRVSYGIGVNLGRSGAEAKQMVELNMEYFMRGFQDGLAAKTDLLVPVEELQAAFQELQQRVAAQQQQERAAAAEKNMAEGAAFRQSNAQREGVTTTESGLQYEVLAAGDGPKPSATDRVTVHYTGTLIDGTVFDSSVQRGEPATFALNAVVAGWTEALQLMGVGSKWKIVLPPEIGYGERGAGAQIGPNATLVFEVELLGIEGAGS